MDIYSVGEEKCIDGVWGRMVNGKFYTLRTHEWLVRKLDVSNKDLCYCAYIEAQGKDELVFRAEYQYIGTFYYPYKPKPIEHKRGDVVWVKTTLRGETYWHSCRFILQDEDGYLVTNSFHQDDATLGRVQNGTHVSEVFLEPPFSF